jgi:tetratricopeptide (TPR) repeat protein
VSLTRPGLAGTRAAAALLLALLAVAVRPETGARATTAGQPDERAALDSIYALLGERRFAEAKDAWNRLAPTLQQGLRSPSSSPAEERDRQARVAEALFVQGLLAARTGSRDEALQLLRQADGYGFPPLDSPLMRLAAECLAFLQEPALAAQAWREVLKRAPEDVPARLGLGAALLASGLIGPAEKEARAALAGQPDAPQAHLLLGAALLEGKRAEEARTHLERALETDPRCVGCMARLAHVAYLAGDDRQCESWLAKALAVDPGDVESHLVAGMLANRKGRHEQAIEHLSRVVGELPGSTSAQYQLALAYRRTGNAEKAREHQAVYDRLIREQKARTLGVRGSEER